MKPFAYLWTQVTREQPPDPKGAAGELVGAIAEKLEVEQIEYAHPQSYGALFLLNLSALGFKDLDLNVVMVAHPPRDDAEARAQAELLRDCRHALNSTGFCFLVSTSADGAPAHSYLPTGGDTVHIGGADVERLLSSNAPAMVLFDVIRRQVHLERLCPFNVTHEARADTFRGRRQELGRLIHDRDSTFLVTGARRIGKTSLMKRAYSILRNTALDRRGDLQERNVFFFNCLTWGDYFDCAARLSHKIDPRSEQRIELGTRNVLYMLQRRSHGGNQPLVLFFDELDAVVEREMASGWRFFGMLAEATSEGWVRSAFAGYRSVKHLYIERDVHAGTPGARTPFHGALQPLELCPLSRDDACSLLRDPIHQVGMTFAEEVAALNRVWEMTWGHPFMIQFIGEQLFRSVQARGSREVRADDVEAVAESEGLSRFVETHFLESTLFRGQPVLVERLAVVRLAQATDGAAWTIEEFLEACQGPRPDTSLDEVHAALQNLCHAGITLRQGGAYRFAFPLIQKVLRRAFPHVHMVLGMRT